MNSKGGVVTWDVPILESGLIPEPFLRQLAAVGEARRGAPLHPHKHG